MRMDLFVASAPARCRAALRLLPWLLAFTGLLGCEDDPVQILAPEPIDSPEKLIETLAGAYQQRDATSFVSLLANDPHGEYEFLLADPVPEGEIRWGYAEEARIHRRMFHPEAPQPGDGTVPADLWPQSLTVILTRATPFTERTDLYISAGGTLDSERWRALEALYVTYLFADLAGETDYRVEGGARFVVLEDLEKNVGDPGKFVLSTWQDFPALSTSVSNEGMTWSAFKRIYR